MQRTSRPSIPHVLPQSRDRSHFQCQHRRTSEPLCPEAIRVPRSPSSRYALVHRRFGQSFWWWVISAKSSPKGRRLFVWSHSSRSFTSGYHHSEILERVACMGTIAVHGTMCFHGRGRGGFRQMHSGIQILIISLHHAGSSVCESAGTLASSR
jgi:hypothetical protein